MERDMIKISSAKSETKYIAHHGTEGMHWGKRKYQYEDGSLTPLGRIHYGVGEVRERSKIKMREARDAAKNEARVIKAQAKADAMKYKAEAKAYRAKKDAEEETERRRIEADKEMERNFGKEKTKQTQIEADARVEMNRQQYEPQQVKEKNYTALKVAGGLLAAAGIGYLLYKTFKSGSGGGGNQTFSKEVASKGEDTIKKLENSPASEIAKKGDEAVKSGGKSLGFFARRKAEKQAGKDFGNAALERLEKANRNAEVAKKVENANRLVKNDAINEMRRMADANATSAANQTKASRVLKSNFTRMVNKTNKGGVKSQPWGNKPAGLENFGSFLKDYRKKHGTVFTARHSDGFMEGYVLVHSANPDVCHWGILGQKWGVRRYQNPDGTLTELGKQHYGRKFTKKLEKADKSDGSKNSTLNYLKVKATVNNDKGIKAFNKEYNQSESGKKMINSYVDRMITNLKITNEMLERMREKYGDDYPSDDENVRAQQEIEAGKEFIKLEKKYSEESVKSANEYLEATKEYEEKANEFLKGYLGESASKYSSTGMKNVTIKEEGKYEVRDATLQDRVLGEMKTNLKIPVNTSKTKNLKGHLESLKDYDPDDNSWQMEGKKVKTEDLATQYKSMSKEQKTDLLRKLEYSYIPGAKFQPIHGLTKAMEDIFEYEGKKYAKELGYNDVNTREDFVDLGRRKLGYD